MRVTILSLFLYGTTAFCQSSAPPPVIAENLARTPIVIAPPRGRDFSKLPPGWRAVPLADPKVMMGPAMTQHGVYPNLRMGPIELTNSALEAIPTMWPRYRLETIPTQWPRHEMVPVRGGFEVTAHSPGN
jgi:hypothetical protein